MQIEHYHRYLFARSLVLGLDVLDVASGEGYGSALLAQVARQVIGVDHSGATVRGAADNFVRPNLHFLQGDARALPLADACADCVISFETIEHFDRQDDFLREVRRVLRPGGSFIVSTPDRDIYSPAGAPANPFHVRELNRSEFTSLLHSTFRHVQVMQQRALIGSALLADTGSPTPSLVFDRRGDTHFEACIGLPRAPYLIAVASDRELPPLPPSLYIHRGDLDTETFQRLAIADQLQQVQADLAQARQQTEQSRQQAEQARQQRRAEQATERAEQATERAEQARQLVERTTQRAEQAEHARVECEERGEAVQRRHDLLAGSLRTFLRGYLPRLSRHLFGQRP